MNENETEGFKISDLIAKLEAFKIKSNDCEIQSMTFILYGEDKQGIKHGIKTRMGKS